VEYTPVEKQTFVQNLRDMAAIIISPVYKDNIILTEVCSEKKNGLQVFDCNIGQNIFILILS
jgi:hypothetical protein